MIIHKFTPSVDSISGCNVQTLNLMNFSFEKKTFKQINPFWGYFSIELILLGGWRFEGGSECLNESVIEGI